MADVDHILNTPNSPDVKIPGLSEEERKKAAEIIQRTYRGHRERRQRKGFGLDASTRWAEAVKDARYKNVTHPRPPQPPSPTPGTNPDANDGGTRSGSQRPNSGRNSVARQNWFRATEIAKHAGADDKSPSVSGESSDDAMDGTRVARRRSGDPEAKKAKRKTAKMMDLQYFLEMVDRKHRYGSNLRKYHNVWKNADTKQNFFYWLDEGEGQEVELEECSRTRLNTEQVRYLSREERLNYLVQVNEDGKLVWAKNGEYVWTKDELYKDSIKGIVATNDPTPPFKCNIPPPGHEDESSSTSDSDNDDDDDENFDNTQADEGERYVNEDFHRAKGPAKLKHVSAAVLFNHMIRTSLKKGHKWIFVADTSFRLYIGYKQSGAFQHSSFLNGARISAAGLIKVKDGRLRSLSPLSGHYRPPVSNFRAFVHSLQNQGVDMSQVSISKSYAVLMGLEAYVKVRRKVKTAKHVLVHQKDKLVNPEKAKREEEEQIDTSKSAARERAFLEEQQAKEMREAGNTHPNRRKVSERVTQVLSKVSSKSEEQGLPVIGRHSRKPGTGPEDGVPPPDGSR